MKVDVAMPWRPQPDRIDAYNRVQRWWRDNGFNVVTADSRRGPFNRSNARNNAVKKCTSDVIVVADADTIPDLAALHVALDNPVGVTYPFNRYRYLPPDAVGVEDLSVVPSAKDFRGSVGGLLVTSRDTWELLGGMDERFRSWGFEDTAFCRVAETLSSTCRVPGVVFSFGHDEVRDLSVSNPGLARYQLYKFASGRPDVMRELIKR